MLSGSHGGWDAISTLGTLAAKYISTTGENLMLMGRQRQYKQALRLSVSFEKADYDRVSALAQAYDGSTA